MGLANDFKQCFLEHHYSEHGGHWVRATGFLGCSTVRTIDDSSFELWCSAHNKRDIHFAIVVTDQGLSFKPWAHRKSYKPDDVSAVVNKVIEVAKEFERFSAEHEKHCTGPE